ncbi:unnamed protein product [Blepharisma stoltei]|uniref:RING-type domain-containing protein n=1 Tax=Blepharisma stoltei TaxID=1481888 RepID=A0AAU9INM5_9CILI|nr:unnamed protein product [Blepharisma stoltei]
MGCLQSNPPLMNPEPIKHSFDLESFSPPETTLHKLCIQCSKDHAQNKSYLIEKFHRAYDSCERFRKSLNKFDLLFSRKTFQAINVSNDDFECKKCNGLYNNKNEIPVLLPCSHTACYKCLKSEYERKGVIYCPFDGQDFDENPDNLPWDNAWMSMIDDSKSTIFCETHNLLISRYCLTDKELLCTNCLSSHNSHQIVDISSQKIINELKLKKEKTNIYIEKLRSQSEKINSYQSQAEEIELALKATINTHINAITEMKDTLIKKIIENCQSYSNELEFSLKKLENISTHSEIQLIHDQLNYELQKAEEFLYNFSIIPISERLDKLQSEESLSNQISKPDISVLQEIKFLLARLPDPTVLVLSLSLGKIQNLISQ